jgi:hypothetical protein
MTEQTLYEQLGGVNAIAMGFGGRSSLPRPSSVRLQQAGQRR